MKKFLALFLALIMCLSVLVACGDGNGKDTESETQKPTDATEAATLAEAKEFLDSQMKSKNGKALSNDYDVLGILTLGTTKFNVTWAVDNTAIKVVESSKENFWTIDLPDANDAEVEYKLTATIKATDGTSVETSYTIKLPALNKAGVVTDLKADVEYKIFMNQASLGYTVYALNTTQDNKNQRINTTMKPQDAAVYKVEIVDGGYKFYTMIDGVKNYVHAALVANGDKVSKYIGFATETTTVFTYDKDLAVYKVTIDGTVYGVGTYQAYDTISLSEATYFKADNINVPGGQFPIGFMTAEYANTLEESKKPITNDPAADSTLTIADAIALGNTKASGVYTDGKYYISGTIKEIKNTTYGNIVITDGTNDILIYGTYDATGANRFDKLPAKPAVGDTIKVYGKIGSFDGTPQMEKGWIVEGLPAAGDIPAAQPCTISEALTKEVGTKVIISGIVVSADTWDAEHNNMSITIMDDEGNSIYVFRTSTQVEKGDFVTVTGDVAEYQGAKQIGQGSTCVKGTADNAHMAIFELAQIDITTNYTADVEVTLPTAFLKFNATIAWTKDGNAITELNIPQTAEAQTVTVKVSVTVGDATVDKEFTIIVAEKLEAGTTVVSKTMTDLIAAEGWTGTTTKQEFKLDDVVTCKVDGGNNSGKAYTDHIRIYATDTPAGTLTITLATGYELVSVKVSTVTGTYAFLCVDGTTADISNVSTDVSGSSVILNSVKNGSDGKQVRVTAIEVVYKQV